MEDNTLTPDEFKIEFLKSRISELVAGYEEAIANQAIHIAQLTTKVEELTKESEN